MPSKLIPRGKKGVYYFRYCQNGKQRWFCTHTNVRIDAERQRQDKVSELISNKSHGIRHNSSWDSFVNEYLAYSAANKRPRSVERDRMTINTFNKLFPLRYFSEYTYSILEQFKAKRKEAGVKESSINRELNTLKNMGKLAVRLKHCSQDPVKDVKRYYDEQGKRDRFLSREEAVRLIGGIQAVQLKTVCVFGLLAATRLGEALHMTWNDIDFMNNRIYFTEKDGWKPKTKIRQVVPLNTELKSYLLGLKRYGDYVCAYEDGSVMGENVASALISRRAKELDIKNATSHTLRHTCLSWLAQTAPFLTVVRFARHTNPKMTMRYAHLSPEFQSAEINKLPKIL